MLTGTMKLKYTAGLVQVILTNIDTKDKITLEAVPSGEPDEEGLTLFSYQTWSLPHQVFKGVVGGGWSITHVICYLFL